MRDDRRGGGARTGPARRPDDPPPPSSGFAVAGRRRGGAGGAPGAIRGGQLSKSVAKAPRTGIDREKKRGISTIRFRHFDGIRAFATDLDNPRRHGLRDEDAARLTATTTSTPTTRRAPDDRTGSAGMSRPRSDDGDAILTVGRGPRERRPAREDARPRPARAPWAARRRAPTREIVT